MPDNSKAGSRRGKSNSHGTGSSASGQGKSPRTPLTHFLCIPLITASSRPALDSSLSRFKESIAAHGDADGDADDTESWDQAESAIQPDVGAGVAGSSRRPISPPGGMQASSRVVQTMMQALRPVGTLHLTLGVMSLTTPERVAGAVALLRSLDLQQMLREAAIQAAAGTGSDEGGAKDMKDDPVEDSAEPVPDGADGSGSTPPLTLTLSSLLSMHEPSSTTVLYAAPLDHSDRLLPFCRALVSRFRESPSESSFLVADDRPLKLHATVLNTVYAATSRSGQGARGRHRGKPLRIDARPLLKQFEDFTWAESVEVERVAICKMGARKVRDGKGDVIGEEYEEIASVRFALDQ